MSKRINNTSHAPAMHLAYRDHCSCAGTHSAVEHSVWIGNRQDHAYGPLASNRFRAEVVMLWGFIAQPELRAADREPRNHGSVRGVNTERLSRSKRRFVKRNGFSALPH